MCEPVTVTLAAAGMAAGLAGSGMAAYGQIEQGKAEASAMRANAANVVRSAADVEARGRQQAGQVRLEAGQAIGAQKVAFGASGVDGSVGSPLALAADSRMQAELDAQTLKNNAAREAWGMRSEAADLRRLATRTEKASKRAAVGTLLGGFGSTAASAASFNWKGR